jgi:hypothetical protein
MFILRDVLADVLERDRFAPDGPLGVQQLRLHLLAVPDVRRHRGGGVVVHRTHGQAHQGVDQ